MLYSWLDRALLWHDQINVIVFQDNLNSIDTGHYLASGSAICSGNEQQNGIFIPLLNATAYVYLLLLCLMLLVLGSRLDSACFVIYEHKVEIDFKFTIYLRFPPPVPPVLERLFAVAHHFWALPL